MVTLSGAESAAFTQVMEVTQTEAECGRMGNKRAVMLQKRQRESCSEHSCGVGRWRKGARLEALDFSPHSRADFKWRSRSRR